MKVITQLIIFILFTSLFACKSPYEKLRTNTDAKFVLKAANQYYEEEEYLKAQTLYEQIIPFFRGKDGAEELFYKFSYTHYYLKEYTLAAHYFKSFSNTYFNSSRKEEALFMSAYSHYKMSPIFRLDQGSSEVAINEMQGFINTFPSSPRVDEANQLIDEMRAKMELKAYDQGKLYYNLKNYNSAISALESMLKDFPETKRAEEVRFLIIQSSYQWAIKSIYEKREERLKSTIELTDKFQRKYTTSTYADKCDDIRAKCNNDLKRFEND